MRPPLKILKQGRLSLSTHNVVGSLKKIPIDICQSVPYNTKASADAKLPTPLPNEHNNHKHPLKHYPILKITNQNYIKASGMQNQPHRVTDAAPTVSFPTQPRPSPQEGPQPFIIFHQYLDGTEIRCETIQTAVCEAGVTCWSPEMVVYQQPGHRTPTPPQSRDRGCLNELAIQVLSLPGNYGSSAPAYLLEVPREPLDGGGAIAPAPVDARAAAPVELDGQNGDLDGQMVEPGEQISDLSQAARTEPQRANAPRSLEAIMEGIEAGRAKPKQSWLCRYLKFMMGSP